MSCHSSCSSCSLSGFTDCLSCPTGSSLVSGACLCSYDWQSACTYNSALRGFYQTAEPFYSVLFPLVMVLFYLRARLPLSFRIVAGMQGLSLLIFSNKLYLYSENQFGLRLLARAHGFYSYSSRLQSLSIGHAVGPLVLLGGFLLLYFLGLQAFEAFHRRYPDYGDYLQENWIHLLFCWFYFASRMMAYFMGAWINAPSTSLAVLLPFCLFGLLSLAALVLLFYGFHKGTLSPGPFQPELFLYSMLSGLSVLGLPFVSSSTYFILIYVSPLAVLLLLILLNKGYQVFSPQKVLFYGVEVLVMATAVAFVLLGDIERIYVTLVAIALAVVGIAAEMTYLYYSGVPLQQHEKRSLRKIYPENNSQDDSMKEKDSVGQRGSGRGPKGHSKKASKNTEPVRKSYF